LEQQILKILIHIEILLNGLTAIEDYMLGLTPGRSVSGFGVFIDYIFVSLKAKWGGVYT